MTENFHDRKDGKFWVETPLEQLGPTLNSIGVAVFVIDVEQGDNYRIAFINHYYERVFNVSARELVGREIREVLSEDAAIDVIAHYRRCIESGQMEQYDEEILLPSGVHFSRTTLTPLRNNGTVDRIIGTAIDITDRRRMELDLENARDRADVANKAKSSFMANMSHELRTPLNAVIGYSEMIQGEYLGPLGHEKYKEYVGDIRFAGQHLLDIVNDILDLARVEAGQSEIDEETIPVRDLVESALTLVTHGRDGDTVEFATGNILEDVSVRVDRKHIRQCLINLLANARKFSRKSDIVHITTELLDDERLCFAITDSGRGIAAKDLPVALAPFGRVDSAMDASTQGAGLGLPITRAFIEQHGGDLFLNSVQGIGTTVFLVLPRSRVELPEGTRATPTIEGLKDLFTVDGVNIPKDAVSMADGMLDRLPLGAVLLDRHGKVLRYNETESGFSEMKVERVVGRNFFKEVAPCTFTDEFHGRFNDICTGKVDTYIFSYVFTLRRPWKVLIQMRADKKPGNVWLFIRWT